MRRGSVLLLLPALLLSPSLPRVSALDIFGELDEIVSGMELNLNKLEQNNEDLKNNISSLESTIQEKEILILESEGLLKAVQDSYGQTTTQYLELGGRYLSLEKKYRNLKISLAVSIPLAVLAGSLTTALLMGNQGRR
jgi:regulator of replication initiation timing